jgi:hypothetical protein
MTAQKQRSDPFAMLADSIRKDPPKNPNIKLSGMVNYLPNWVYQPQNNKKNI